jgi:triacylglycerol lipase
MAGVERRLLEITDAHGPAALVGLSMGGLFCRWLARRRPARVSQVITVCSPFRASVDSFWLPLRPLLGVWPVPGLLALADEMEHPLPVPTTSLYSPTDGIVASASCHDPDRPDEAFAIPCGHVTISRDSAVRTIILRRLASQDCASQHSHLGI